MTRVLVLGGAGMLGHKLCQVLGSRFDLSATFRGKPPDVAGVFENTNAITGIDATDMSQLNPVIRRVRPAFVLNAVGLVKQRSEANDAIQAIAINSLLPHQLAAICEREGARLVHISTDCVFSGTRGRYTEDDLPDPVDLYGRSKLLGEVEAAHVLTIRTSIIGRELRAGLGLIEWFLSNAGGKVRGYRQAIYTGLTTRALSMTIGDVLDGKFPTGIWHVSTHSISKFDLLREVNKAFGTNTTVEPDDAFRIDRSLISDRFWAATELQRPSWQTMIGEMAADRTPYPRKGGVTTVN